MIYSLGSVDVDRIYRERDFASLEYSLQYILDGPLGSLLESRALDAAVSKLFRVSQLAIQYLLFCKQFLDRSVTVMRATIKEQQKVNKIFNYDNFKQLDIKQYLLFFDNRNFNLIACEILI